MAITINQGTQSDILTTQIGGTETQIIRLDVGVGTTRSDFGGSIANVANLAKGTITMIEGGTIGILTAGTINALASGTITNGTLLTIGLRHADEFATQISSGTSVLGTIRGSVAGSQIFVTGLVISVGSASNVEIGSGGTSTNIAGTFFFNANGGAVLMPINPPLRTASGSALVYKQSVSGPLSIMAQGYIE